MVSQLTWCRVSASYMLMRFTATKQLRLGQKPLLTVLLAPRPMVFKIRMSRSEICALGLP